MSGKIVCVESVEDAVAALRERGLHESAAHTLVLEALVAADGPVSAERIAEGIEVRVPRFDRASVYPLYALAGAVAAATAALIVLH